jgi:hypothetical protein
MKKSSFVQILPVDAVSNDIQFEVCNPIGITDTDLMQPAPRLNALQNKRIGLFWNSKARGDVALRHAATLLAERFDGLEFTWFRTDNSTALAPVELEQIAEQKNDAIISTTGD